MANAGNFKLCIQIFLQVLQGNLRLPKYVATATLKVHVEIGYRQAHRQAHKSPQNFPKFQTTVRMLAGGFSRAGSLEGVETGGIVGPPMSPISFLGKVSLFEFLYFLIGKINKNFSANITTTNTNSIESLPVFFWSFTHFSEPGFSIYSSMTMNEK